MVTKTSDASEKKKEARKNRPVVLQLPIDGMSRWEQLSHFIPVSRETWRKLVVSGKAPPPFKPSLRCTMYPNKEIHRWLANPAEYQA